MRGCELDPALVTVSVTPFGRTGPYRHYKGSDAIANATGGFLFGQGDNAKVNAPRPAISPIRWRARWRRCSASPGFAMRAPPARDSASTCLCKRHSRFPTAAAIARYSRENRLERRPGGKAYGGAGTNIYRCKDGRYVHFTTNMLHMWKEFAQNWMTDKSLAGPEWENPRYRDEHSAEVAQAFAKFIGEFDADDFANQAQARHLAAAPLNTIGQFVDCEQNRARMAAGNRPSGDRQVPSAGRAHASVAHADARAPAGAVARSASQRNSS